MKQESIGPDSSQPGSFGNEAELQSALSGIPDQVGVVSFSYQLVPDCFAHTPKVIIRVAAFFATHR
jgi:hypothetical protein